MSVTQLLSLSSVSKEFPGVKALDKVHFDLNEGEVHAIVGENGAGKSTLMKILSGIYKKDSGEIIYRGKSVSIPNPHEAQKLGISIIHQELNLMPHLTVAQNIYIGREDRRIGKVFIDNAKLNNNVLQLLKELDLNLDPKAIVGELSIAKQQMVEIAKAVSYRGSVIIMDEPTSSLTPTETESLFKIIRNLKASGIGYLSEDRKRFGLLLIQDITFNIILSSIPKFSKLGWLKIRPAGGVARDAISQLKVRTPSESQFVKNLSGGNQQKVVVGKWLTRNCDVLIFDEPTRGIDVGAKDEIYRLLTKLSEEGKSIIMISSELPEILRMSDRIAVMCNGRLTGILENKDASQEKIIEYATKFSDNSVVAH